MYSTKIFPFYRVLKKKNSGVKQIELDMGHTVSCCPNKGIFKNLYTNLTQPISLRFYCMITNSYTILKIIIIISHRPKIDLDYS